MERVLLYVIFVLAATILVAVWVERARPVAKAMIAALIYVPSLFTWWALQYLRVLPVDTLLAQILGIQSHQLAGTSLGTAWLFGPPVLPSVALLCWFTMGRRRNPEGA